jgi:hypothetical protein
VQDAHPEANLLVTAAAAHAMTLCALRPAPAVLHQLALGANGGAAFNHLESPSAKPAIETASLDTFCDECGAPIPPTDSYWADHSSGKVGCRGCRDASASDAGGQSADTGWAFVPPAARVAAHANAPGGSSSGIAPVATKGSASNSTGPKSSSAAGGGGGGRGKAKGLSGDVKSCSGGKAKDSCSDAESTSGGKAKSSSASGGTMLTTSAKEGGGGGAPTTAAKSGGSGGSGGGGSTPTATAKEGDSGAAAANAENEGGSGCAPTTAVKEGGSGGSGGVKNSQKRPAAAAGLALSCPARRG